MLIRVFGQEGEIVHHTKCIVSQIAVTVLLLSGCGAPRSGAATLDELLVVQREVGHAVGGGEVRVNVGNGRHLTVSLVNSPLKELPASRRHVKALEIARLAYDSYASRASLESVDVTFVVRRTYLRVFNYSDATDHVRFTVRDLLVGRQQSGV